MPARGAFDMHAKHKEMKQCADCPTKIPAYGGKDRCAACASIRSDELKRLRDAKRRRKWQPEDED